MLRGKLDHCERELLVKLLCVYLCVSVWGECGECRECGVRGVWCVCVCVYVCMCMYVCVCACASVRARVTDFPLPRLSECSRSSLSDKIMQGPA